MPSEEEQTSLDLHYVRPPWVLVQKEDLLDNIEQARSHLLSEESSARNLYYQLNDADAAFDKEIGKEIRDILFGKPEAVANIALTDPEAKFKEVEIGDPQFYINLHENYLLAKDHIQSLLSRESSIDCTPHDQPPEYLKQFGDKYKLGFGNAPTNPFQIGGYTLQGALWRDATLVSLHETVQALAEEDPTMFVSMMLTEEGQE